MGGAVECRSAVPDEHGRSEFAALQDELNGGSHGRFVFYAFDLLYLDGLDLRDAALVDRKHVLAELTQDCDDLIRYSEHLEEDGPTVYRNACAMNLEGIVSKRRDAPYRSDRSDAWLKSVCRQSATFVERALRSTVASSTASTWRGRKAETSSMRERS